MASRSHPPNRVSFPALDYCPSLQGANPDGNELAGLSVAQSNMLTFDGLLPGRYHATVMPGFSMQIFLGENEVTGT